MASCDSLGEDPRSRNDLIAEGGVIIPQFKDVVPDRLKCPLCHNVIMEPKQTNCGHRVCSSCIENAFAPGQNHVQCPLIGTEHECEDCSEGWTKNAIYPDNFAKKEILKLRVYCSHKAHGCDHVTLFKDLMAHADNCNFKPVACPNREKGCNDLVPQHLKDRHAQECRFRTLHCEHCSVDLEEHQRSAHLTECPKRPVICKDCTITYPLHRERRHQTSECLGHVGQCIFGCSFVGSNSAEMKYHYDAAANLKDHLHRAVIMYSEMMEKLEDANTEITRLAAEVEGVRKQAADNKHDIRRLQLVTAANCDLLESLPERFMEKDQFTSDKVNSQRTIHSLTERVNALERSQGPGSANAPDLQSSVQQSERTLMLHDVRLAELDQRLSAMDLCSYDGTLVWKIRDYHRRKLEAVQGRTLSIYSPPFFTSRFGYKSCARIYLNGDGTGKGHHVSLFFVVMKGEYDALLPWPFKQKVTLMLLDQTSAKKHLSDTFRPDPNSSSFQKPSTEMNIASGCPQFVSHEVLEKESPYLKEDTIFIRIKIDLEGL